MYNLKKTSPINYMNSIQYIFDVECDNTVEREPREEIEDNSIQFELMNPFYEVKVRNQVIYPLIWMKMV